MTKNERITTVNAINVDILKVILSGLKQRISTCINDAVTTYTYARYPTIAGILGQQEILEVWSERNMVIHPNGEINNHLKNKNINKILGAIPNMLSLRVLFDKGWLTTDHFHIGYTLLLRKGKKISLKKSDRKRFGISEEQFMQLKNSGYYTKDFK